MKTRKAPCKECPYRRKSAPGWLGGNSPERMAVSVLAEQPVHCHTSVNYSDPEWEKKFLDGRNGRQCAGSLIFAANLLKRPRDPKQVRPPDKELVFDSVRAMVDHHRNSPVRSWGQAEDALGRQLRLAIGLD